MCDIVCETGSIHQIECKLFSDAFIKQSLVDKDAKDSNQSVRLKPPDIIPGHSPVPFYSCIGPLRLLLKTRDGMISNIGKSGSKDSDVSICGKQFWFL